MAAHAALTDWIVAHPTEAQAAVLAELAAETRAEIKPELVAHAWPRLVLTAAIDRPAIEAFVTKSKNAGFLKTVPDLGRLFEAP